MILSFPQYLKELIKPYWLKIKYRRANKAFLANGNEVLLLAKKALDEVGVHFWLDFGTLLGIYRDGKLIGHDTDIDLAVLLNDHSPKIAQSLQKHGFKMKRRYEIEGGAGMEENFKYRQVNLDIFYYTQKEGRNICHLFPLDENENFVVRELYTTNSGFSTIDFLGHTFNIPGDPDLRLRETYGDYTIPDSKWYTPDDALNSEIIDTNCKVLKFK